MKKTSLIILLIIGINNISFSQDLSEFSNELSRLKRIYKEKIDWETNVDDLKSSIQDINIEVNYLKTNFENYIEEKSIAKTNYFSLLNEIENFADFTSNSPTCNCLYYANNFLSELGGSKLLVKENNGIKVFKATIGNFNYYYAYSINYMYYNVTIISHRGNNHSNFNFGMAGEIDFFHITESSSLLNIISLTAAETPASVLCNEDRCKNEFPRK